MLNFNKAVFNCVFSVIEFEKEVFFSKLVDSFHALNKKLEFYCPDTETDKFVNNIKQLADKQNVALCIVAHHGNFPSMEYLAHALRKEKKIALFAVYLSNSPNTEIFDGVLDCQGSLAVLSWVIQNIPCLPVYVQAHARWVYLGALVKSLMPNSLVIQEVYDWMSFFIAEQNQQRFIASGLFTRQEMRIMKFYERHLHFYLDGLVYKGKSFPTESSSSGKLAISVQMLPSPPASWTISPSGQLKGSNPRLVFAGQVKSRLYYPQVFGDLYYIPVIHALTKQGLKVDIYASHSRDEQQYQEQFSDYLNEESINPLFSMHHGIPVRELISSLSQQFDYGLIVHFFPADLWVGKEHFETALASKLYTYLAAGLPVIVSQELTYMANWVLEHKVGLVVSEEEMLTLAKKLKSVDYAALCANVSYVQKRLALEKKMDDIHALLFPKSCRSVLPRRD